MRLILKVFFTFMLAFTFLLTTIIITGCPSEKGIEKAAKTSLRLSDLTRDAIAATSKAYQNHLISPETKDKMTAQLDKVISGGQSFNATVKKVYDEYKASGKQDINALHLLDSLLTSNVTTPFLSFLQLMGAVTPEQAPYLWAAVNALRAALLLIGSFVSVNTTKMLTAIDNFKDTIAYENKIPLGGKSFYVMKLC